MTDKEPEKYLAATYATDVGDIDTFLQKPGVKIVQITAPWCAKCVTLKQQINDGLRAEFDDLSWLVVDLEEVEGASEALELSAMPRVDVVGSKTTHEGGTPRVTLEGFECTADAVWKVVRALHPPKLVLDEDF